MKQEGNAAVVLPPQVRGALERMERAGEEAYAVGGCVRDSLLGRTPHDWDLTTSARPERVQRIFQDVRVISTGIAHGTLTVLLDGMPLEITTYRIDGPYKDHRRPARVAFTPSLTADLLRRDFTMNALAYHPKRGLVDPAGGENDLRAGRIRCVGAPDTRFQEDALRILRALRFASTLGFSIEEETARAIRRQRALLRQIAAERIAAEFTRLLCGRDAVSVLLEYPEVLAVFLPELPPLFGFDQQNPYHIYNVWEHTARSVGAIRPEPVPRLTMLFHDAGKPACFSLDERGGHFYGHAEKSRTIAGAALRRLRFDTRTREAVDTLIQYHDTQLVCSARAVRRWLNRLGPDRFFDLLAVKRADNSAQSPDVAYRRAQFDEIERLARETLDRDACFSLRDLAVDGRDLLRLGVAPGPAVGKILRALLSDVMDEACPNEKTALLLRAERYDGR